MTAPLLILSALAGLCLFFALFYFLAARLNNYGIVDIVWAYAFAVLAIYYAVGGSGWPLRRGLIATLASLWSLRLGTHLYRRVMSHHPIEDGRYQQLRKNWAGNFPAMMFGFFQLQALSVVVLAAAFAFVGAFHRPADSQDPALRATLAPGNSPVEVTDTANTTGTALVELHALPKAPRLPRTRTCPARSGPNFFVSFPGFMVTSSP